MSNGQSWGASNEKEFKEKFPALFERYGSMEEYKAAIHEEYRKEYYNTGQDYIAQISKEYKIPKKFIEQKFYEQDLESYEEFESSGADAVGHVKSDAEGNVSWLGGEHTKEGKPELGYPQILMRDVDQEKRIMPQMKKDYDVYKSQIRRTPEDKIMDSWEAGDSKSNIMGE
tara:strand:+ start:93 stop:605 length:513 start_codon:yes stop_codon:yes gene_type:complete